MNTPLLNATRIATIVLFGWLGLVVPVQAETRLTASLVLDSRHGHNHYYPAPGAVVRTLPRDAYATHYHGTPYYFRGGVWYRPMGARFVVARAPIGTVITVLPPFYTTVWYGGVPYYYADDEYYRWDASMRGYVVSAPPDGSPASNAMPPAATSKPDEVFVYPKQGQSEAQQATDRYECYRWAADQSGFDPTKTQGGVDAGATSSKRLDYQRAQAACLEARGYSVK